MRSSQVLLVLAFAALSCAFRIPFLKDFALEESSSYHQKRSVESTCATPGNLTCVTSGETCYVPGSSNSYICLGGICDYFSTYKCPAVAALGQNCTNTACDSAYECHPVTEVCVLPTYIVPAGGSCTHNDQCIIRVDGVDQISNCTNGVCFGIPIGGACQYTVNCFGASFCNNGVCAAALATGAACNVSNDASGGCVVSDSCYNGACTRLYSGAAGASCNFDSDCGAGLFCSGTSAAAGTCNQPGTPGVACDTSSSCSNGAYCGCGAGYENTTCVYPVANTATEITIDLAFLDCLTAQSCGDFNCAVVNCAPQYCAYRNAIISQFNSSNSNCYYEYLFQGILLTFPAPASCSAATTTSTTTMTMTMTGDATVTSTGATVTATSTTTIGGTATTNSASKTVDGMFVIASVILACIWIM